MRDEREAGFTLIEVLVALVMSALLVTILLNGAALARRQNMRGLEKQKAIFLARTILAQAAAMPVGQFPTEGKLNGFHWTLDEQSALLDPRGLFTLSQLSVAISGASGRELFRVSTRRLKRLPRR